MIFYFTGTGNSLYAAKKLAGRQGEKLVSIAAAASSGKEIYEYDLQDDEVIGFVHPVHAWGPPPVVLDFIRRLKLRNFRGNYVFAVATCGGSAGNAMKVMARSLREQGLPLIGGYSVIMPNNYIMMGDVDSEQIRQEKLAAADETLQYIHAAVARKAQEWKISRGQLPWLTTGLIYPMFAKSTVNTAKFHVTEGCTGCAICAKVCNGGNIRLRDGKPEWGANCTQCSACLHYCPVQAVQYGNATGKKGRYINPYVSLAEIAKGKAFP